MSDNTSKATTTILDVLKYMKNKVPSFLLFIHVIFFNYMFETCTTMNTTNFGNTTHSEKFDIFVGYYIFATMFCVVWEFLFCYFKIKKADKGIVTKKDYLFCAISSFISLLAFLSTTFFMDIRNAYQCYMSYDKTLASVVFFMSYAIIIGFSLLEKYCFATEVKIMSTSLSDNEFL